MSARTRSQMLDETRAKLILAAREVFARKGYAGASMDELTALVGLTRGALYHHFGGKEGLLEAVVLSIDSEIDACLVEISSTESHPMEALRKRARAYIERTSEPEVQQIMFHDAPAVLREGLATTSRACIDSIAEIIDGGQSLGVFEKSASPLALAVGLNGALADLSRWISGAIEAEQPTRLEEGLAAADFMVVSLGTAR